MCRPNHAAINSAHLDVPLVFERIRSAQSRDRPARPLLAVRPRYRFQGAVTSRERDIAPLRKRQPLVKNNA